ncbi:MAG: spermidine/putrescine ABC transporter substrate-binding protein [Clostridia bacterium]|nr:spermidine/putrescine ABC transporter substrate-binding protein [Clostridia bacterium]
MLKKSSFILSLSFVLILSILFSALPFSSSAYNDSVTINVYNWGQYISDGSDGTIDANEEFTRQTGIKVNYTTFASNEEMYAKLASNGAVYDVIIPSDYMASKLKNQGMLRKLDFSKIPNAQNIDDKFKNLHHDPENEYTVAYTWGYLGLFYNKNFVDASDPSWNMLWDQKYDDKILMFDNPRDAFSIAHFILGNDINSENKSDWLNASELLRAQKPLLQSYVMDQIFNKMGNNEAYIAPYYSGDANDLMTLNQDLEFALPKEGTTFFIDAMCIPENCEHYEEALAYINFMCTPEIMAANSRATGYSTPSTKAKELLTEEEANNPILYPDLSAFETLPIYENLSDETNEYIDELWIDVKTGTQNNPMGLIFVLLGFLGIYVAIVVYKKLKNRYNK